MGAAIFLTACAPSIHLGRQSGQPANQQSAHTDGWFASFALKSEPHVGWTSFQPSTTELPNVDIGFAEQVLFRDFLKLLQALPRIRGMIAGGDGQAIDMPPASTSDVGPSPQQIGIAAKGGGKKSLDAIIDSPPAVLLHSWPRIGVWSVALLQTSLNELACFMLAAPLPNGSSVVSGLRLVHGSLGIEIAVREEVASLGNDVVLAVDDIEVGRAAFVGKLKGRGFQTAFATLSPGDQQNLLRAIRTGRKLVLISGGNRIEAPLAGAERALAVLKTCAKAIPSRPDQAEDPVQLVLSISTSFDRYAPAIPTGWAHNLSPTIVHERVSGVVPLFKLPQAQSRRSAQSTARLPRHGEA